MIIKKFTAPTMTEALAKVREELGTDAVILSTRSENRGGVFDFMGRKVVEVTAAIDDIPLGENQKGSTARRARASSIGPGEAKIYPPRRPVTYEPKGVSGYTGKSGNVEVKDVKHSVNIDAVLDDIKELKLSMKVLADSALTGEMAGLPPNFASLLNTMLASGLDDKIAKRVIRQLLNDFSGMVADPATVSRKAAELLLSSMSEVSPIHLVGAKPRMVAFIGPTGSGKTTTIAKLAADFTLNKHINVSVLTLDTKRVDAVGQLQTYCSILNIPLFITYTPDELPAVMPGIMKSDITLVDTPGSGPMNKTQMFGMVEFLKKMVPQEVHIVMSVTTSFLEMKRIFNNFSILKPNRILFTKLDETDSYGTMLSLAIMMKKPMSYVTFGQSVPGDFSVADPKKLIEQNLSRNKGVTR